jgi:hypothetical protein
MALMTLSGAVTVKRLKKFADNEDRNFEGNSELELRVTADRAGTSNVTLKDGLEWWCADGGWVSAFWSQTTGNPWNLGGTISTSTTRAWPANDVYDPIEHVVFMAKAGDPSGAQPDEWVTAQAPVAIDAATQFTGTIERKPDLLSPPPLPLPINVATEPVFLAVRGPVEAYDLILPSGSGLIRRRTLVLAGQIVNWLKSNTIRELLMKPATVTGSVQFKITVEDHTAGRVVAEIKCFNSTNRKWEPNLGGGEGQGFTMMHDERAAAFLMHIPVPETFSFGQLILEFTWPGGAVKRSLPIRAGDPDILHLPLLLDDGESINFGNGLSANFNSHTLDLHQHLAYDIISVGANGANTAMGGPLAAVANGTVRGLHDSEPDRASGVSGGGVANRIFLEHTHVESRRYAVYAHIQKGSATRATGAIAAGTKVAAMGNNGGGSGEHLHLAYYRLDRFGRMRLLPMAFALRRNNGSEVIVGVPGDGVRAIAAPAVDPNDPIVTKLEVHITTGNWAAAGTDDDVTVTLGGRTFNLDNPGRNDFELGQTDVFLLTPWQGLRVSGLRGSIRIHKSPDANPTGQWLLNGVKVVANGTTIFDRQGLNVRISDAPFFGQGLDWFGTI